MHFRVINANFSNRVQATKVGSFCSEILDIICGVPPGSVLGPLLFNIIITDLFLIEQCKPDFSNYANCDCGNTFLKAISDLETTINNPFDWFCYSNLKANLTKCHLFSSPFNLKFMNIKSSFTQGSSDEKFLEVTLDCTLTFKKRINRLCRDRSQKINALTQCAKYMSIEKRRILFKVFVVSQFSYCPVVWMFHRTELNNRINGLNKSHNLLEQKLLS